MNNRIYCIEYWAYECDDINTGDYEPFYLSLNEQKVKDEFAKWKQIAFNQNEKYKGEIWEDTETTFEHCIGNWVYKYRYISYPLNENLKWKGM